MISNSGMRNAHNDNDKFPFQSIGSVAAELTERLIPERNEKQNENSEGDRADKRDAEQRARDQREYIKRRLREIEAFERRASGHRGPTKRPV